MTDRIDKRRVYLDHNATAPVRPQVIESMASVMSHVGNPSSVHAEGREARRLVEEARSSVAALVGAEPRSVVFTSGATEAANWALSPTTHLTGGRADTRLCLMSAVEHPAVRGGHRFHPALVGEIPVTAQGALDIDAFRLLLDDAEGEVRDGSIIVAVMAANNETGVVQPAEDVAEIVRSRGHIMLCDAVQVAGRLPIDMGATAFDMVTLSAHKIGGPAGIGALVFGPDERVTAEPFLRGGGQEQSRRGGTENIAGIVGFGVAAALAREEAGQVCKISVLRDSLEEGLATISPDVTIYGAEAVRLPNTTCFTAPGLNAETAVIAFDLAGMAVSSGAACSSGKVAPSHVLRAMGVDAETARGAIRVSLGWNSSRADIDAFLAVWQDMRMRSGAAADGVHAA